MAKVVRIDHIAVAVRDIDAGIAAYQRILGAELVEKAEVSIMGNAMRAAYLKVGDGLIVLDGAVEPDGFIARFIERRGEGLHHIGVVVQVIEWKEGDAPTPEARIARLRRYLESRRPV